MRKIWLVVGLFGMSGMTYAKAMHWQGSVEGTVSQSRRDAAGDGTGSSAATSGNLLFFAPVAHVDAVAKAMESPLVSEVPGRPTGPESSVVPSEKTVSAATPAAVRARLRKRQDLATEIPTFLSLLLMGTGLCSGAGICIYRASLLARRAESLLPA